MRRVLYMATISAIRVHPVIRTFYTRVVARANPNKVALVTAMHKFPFAGRCQKGWLMGTDFDRERLVHRPETVRRGGRVNRRRPLPEQPQNLGLGFPVVSGPHLVNHDSMPTPPGSVRRCCLPIRLCPIPSRCCTVSRQYTPAHSSRPGPRFAYRSGSVPDSDDAPVSEVSRVCHVRSKTRKST